MSMEPSNLWGTRVIQEGHPPSLEMGVIMAVIAVCVCLATSRGAPTQARGTLILQRLWRAIWLLIMEQGKLFPFVNRIFEWGVVIATLCLFE